MLLLNESNSFLSLLAREKCFRWIQKQHVQLVPERNQTGYEKIRLTPIGNHEERQSYKIEKPKGSCSRSVVCQTIPLCEDRLEPRVSNIIYTVYNHAGL